MNPWPCALLLVLAACTPDYPFDRAGSWSAGERGVNDDNLRTMIVNPRDLVAGHGENTIVGAEAAQPVRRLLTGQRYPLPATDILQIQVGATSAPAPAAGEGNAGQ